jgi:hypothetical protein
MKHDQQIMLCNVFVEIKWNIFSRIILEWNLFLNRPCNRDDLHFLIDSSDQIECQTRQKG